MTGQVASECEGGALATRVGGHQVYENYPKVKVTAKLLEQSRFLLRNERAVLGYGAVVKEC